jgi:tight adherence protein C
MIAAAVVLALLSAGFVVFGVVADGPRSRSALHWVHKQETPKAKLAHLELARSLAERTVKPALARLAAAVARNVPGALLSETAKRIERAGSPLGLTAPVFAALQVLSAVAGVSVGALTAALLPVPPLFRLGLMALCAPGGVILPGWFIDKLGARRKAVIRKALPDAIDLLVISVEAGLGLDGAVREIVRRESGPLCEELKTVLNEVRLGKRRRDAWRSMADRIGLPELSVFVAALRQAEQMGASIASVLRIQSEAIRTRRSLALREAAAKVPVKMLFPLVLFIFPSVFIVMLGPGAIQMVDTFRTIGW